MRPGNISAKTADRLKEEVYGPMLRLVEERPEARVLLAVALLEAWIAVERQPAECELPQWLRKVSPFVCT